MTQEERAAFFANLPVAAMPAIQPRTFPASTAMMIYPARRPRLEYALEQMAAPIWRLFHQFVGR